MKLLVLASLLAITGFAQTVIEPKPADGSTKYNGICSLIASMCEAEADQCTTAYCRDPGNECFIQGKEYGTSCTTVKKDETGAEREIPGVCVDGECVWSANADCPDPILSAERTFISCGNAGFEKTWRFQGGTQCLITGSSCQDVAGQMSNLKCTTAQSSNDPAHAVFTVTYIDNAGTPDDETDDACLMGEHEDCDIHEPGTYLYKGMEITWSGTVTTENEITTEFTIPYTTKNITPKVTCPAGKFCRGTVKCDMIGPEPCGRVTQICDGTAPPTVNPTTSEPTEAADLATSHGDPIIWTFKGECYDLNVDGTYLASSVPFYDHDVYISVYNYYMRDISVVDQRTGRLLLSLNTLGDVYNHNFPFHFEETVKKCEPHQGDDCFFFYQEYKFDAQDFEYVVQLQPHDYLDPGLKEGEVGVHLDIFPRPFDDFDKHAYRGLYFDNPLPFNEHGECIYE